jgi:beta-lactamase class D
MIQKMSIVLLAAFFFFQSGSAQKTQERDFSRTFKKFGVQGCIVVYNEADDKYIRYNTGICDSGYIPASTFKIPHALIALEEGLIKDTLQIIKWNGHEWPNAPWNQDQTLKTSMKYSCVWVYTGFAEQIDIKTYYNYVNGFNYGNKDLTGPPTRFWLAGQFRISANQQIEFLRKFFNNQLPVSQKSIEIVKDIIVVEETESYKLSGKTGGGMLSETEYIMWLVGYVEKADTIYYYAMNFKSDDYAATSKARYDITREILSELNILK